MDVGAGGCTSGPPVCQAVGVVRRDHPVALPTAALVTFSRHVRLRLEPAFARLPGLIQGPDLGGLSHLRSTGRAQLVAEADQYPAVLAALDAALLAAGVAVRMPPEDLVAAAAPAVVHAVGAQL